MTFESASRLRKFIGSSLVFQITAVCLLLASNAGAEPLEDVRESVVRVEVFSGSDSITEATGFLIAEGGYVMTSYHALRRGDSYSVRQITGEADVTAIRVWSSKHLDVTILHAPGIGGQSLVVTSSPLEAGRLVYSATAGTDSGAEFSLSKGAIGGTEEITAPDGGVYHYTHNAMIPAHGFGSALLDECGRVIAVNRVDPSELLFLSYRGDTPEDVVFAVDITAVAEAIEGVDGFSLALVAEACRPLADVVTEKVEELEQEADAAKQQAEAAMASVEEARREAEAAREAAEQAIEEAQLSQDEIELLVGVAEEKNNQLESARTEAENLARQAEDATERALAEIQKADEAEKRTVLIAIAASFILILFLLLAVRRINRSKIAVTDAANAAAEASARADAAEKLPDRMATPGWGLAPREKCRDGETGPGFDLSVYPQYYFSDEFLSSRNDGINLGRNADVVDILIEHQTVSRLHARIMVSAGSLFVEDLKSANGTWVRGQKLEPFTATAIHSGDEIILGEAVLVVCRFD